MTSQVWMIAITVIYVLAMMALSWYIGKKTTKDETEFMVGGREFTPLMTAVGNGSILISGGYLPSIIMYGYMFGMGGMWFYLGWGTGALVAWLCWAGFWRTTGALTPTEWFEYRYGKGGRMAITIVILFASLAILGWQYVGCGDTIGGALGIDSKLAMLLVGVVVTAYVVFGGIWAATATDLVQFSWVFIIQNTLKAGITSIDKFSIQLFHVDNRMVDCGNQKGFISKKHIERFTIIPRKRSIICLQRIKKAVCLAQYSSAPLSGMQSQLPKMLFR